MALTRAELQKLVEGEDLRYFLDPQREALLLGAQGAHGRYQFVIVLDLGGTFLQWRTIQLHHCPAGHKHILPVLQALMAMNYQMRLVKFAWDPTDGEIVAYADHWVMDGAVTQEQFSRMARNYLPTVDLAYHRVVQIMETGKDPGVEDPASAARSLRGGELPEPLRRFLASLEEAARGAAPEGGDEGKDKKDRKKAPGERVTKL